MTADSVEKIYKKAQAAVGVHVTGGQTFFSESREGEGLLLSSASSCTVDGDRSGEEVYENTSALPAVFKCNHAVELACSEGYPAQEHKVITEDGYVLTVHRIPSGRSRAKVPRSKSQYHKIHLNHHPDFDECVKESLNVTSKGFPVLFVHGLLMASDGWLLQGPGYDLAYIMADNGFDVWLANVRGNFFSRKHTILSPSDPKFWDFSFHENAMIDIPATIDYILKVTKRDKLGYVGLSMGTTIFFSMASMRPEYNDKILGFVAFAPVAYIKEKHMSYRRGFVFRIFVEFVKSFEKRGDVHELFPRIDITLNIGRDYCSKGSQLQDLCYDIMTIFLGDHSKLVLRNKLHLYLTHSPTGTSLKTFQHYLQNVGGNSFKLYNYGMEKNMELYGSPEPPDYPLQNITAPVALYYTDGDFYYDAKDIEDLMKLLPNVMDVDRKHKFNHVDYLWSYTAKDVIYPKAMSFFKKLTDQYYLQRRRKKSIKSRKRNT